jgi:hypothetical protein
LSRFRLKQASTFWTFGTASRQSRMASGMQAALAEAETLMASSPTAETAGMNATMHTPTMNVLRKDILILPSAATWPDRAVRWNSDR